MTTDLAGPVDPDDQERIDEALAEYLVAQDQDTPSGLEEWLVRYPDFDLHLARFLSDQKLFTRRLSAAPLAGLPDMAAGPVHYFGDFELLRVLGRGGMGVVYLARQITLDRLVALKMIRSGHFAGEDELRRFRNEAEAVARLDHPNLLTIFEVGEHDGHRYFTMPLVSGGSLAENLSRFREEPRKAVQILIDVAEAVNHTHQRGILHRDLKPANILIDETGRPLVSDFGLSKRLDGDESSTGGLLGTPLYMAPEQAACRPGLATTASDIYGLGAILFALLTGRPPFAKGSIVEVLQRVANDPPDDPSQLNRRIDQRLRAICLKCLAKEPRHRYASAQALADDLRRWLRGEPVLARPARLGTRVGLWCLRHPAPALLSTLLAAVVGVGSAGVVWQWRKAEYERSVSTKVDRYFRVAFLGFDDPQSFGTESGGSDLPAVDRAERTMGKLFLDLPEVEARIREGLGARYRSLGRPDKAEPQFRRSLTLRQTQVPRDPVGLWIAERELASVLIAQGNLAEGQTHAVAAAHGLTDHLGPNHNWTLQAQSTVAQGLLAAHRPQEAEAIYRALLTRLSATNDTDGHVELMLRTDLALALKADGHPEAAEGEFTHALTSASTHQVSESHPLVRNARNAYAGLLLGQERFDQAATILAPALQAIPTDEADDTSDVLMILGNLAVLRLAQALNQEAETIAARAVRGWERLVPRDHPLLLNGRATLAEAQMGLGHWTSAVEQYQRISRDRPTSPPLDPTTTIYQACQQADALIELHQYPAALALLDPLVPWVRTQVQDAKTDAPRRSASKRLGQLLSMHGAATLASDNLTAAEKDLQEALSLRKENLLPTAWQLAVTKSLLGELRTRQGYPDRDEELLETKKLLEESYLVLEKTPTKVRQRDQARRRLIAFYETTGQLDKAKPLRSIVPSLPVN